MHGDSELIRRDARHVWHPYTQHGLEADRLPVAAARGAVLHLEDGREILDAISSWWCCVHGHCHPELVEAMRRQAERLDHVLFAGATHEPAVRLAERLVALAPAPLERVFFSDDGSTAVEVALKMVIQSWVQRGAPGRSVFVTLQGSYHGDTVGAMALGDPEPFFLPYRPLLFPVRRVAADVAAVHGALAELGAQAAGVVVEPLVQGAGGMRMHPPAFLAGVRALCDEFGVPLVADEVMTGFGRTGTLFACEQAGVAPDLLCLSKGLTGGTLPLAATLATAALFEAFRSSDRSRAFFHGHTFTANPIGCAVALRSLELIEENDVPRRFELLGRRLEQGLREFAASHPRVRELRRRGGIVALELEPPAGEPPGYLGSAALRLRRAALEKGVLLRPLGNVLYAMPPACTTEEQCDRIVAAMQSVVS